MTYPKAVIGDSKYKNKNGEMTHEKINIEMLRQASLIQRKKHFADESDVAFILSKKVRATKQILETRTKTEQCCLPWFSP